jgi:hypothetical protein
MPRGVYPRVKGPLGPRKTYSRLSCPTRAVRVDDFKPIGTDHDGIDFTECALAKAYGGRLVTAPRSPRCALRPVGPTRAARQEKSTV